MDLPGPVQESMASFTWTIPKVSKKADVKMMSVMAVLSVKVRQLYRFPHASF